MHRIVRLSLLIATIVLCLAGVSQASTPASTKGDGTYSYLWSDGSCHALDDFTHPTYAGIGDNAAILTPQLLEVVIDKYHSVMYDDIHVGIFLANAGKVFIVNVTNLPDGSQTWKIDPVDSVPTKYVKIIVSRGTSCSTTTAPPPPSAALAFFCVSKYSKKPFSATLAVAAQRLAAKKAFSPYWVAGHTTLGTTAGAGHLLCAVPSGMKTDGVYRDGNGKVLPRKPGLARLAGAYPEVKKS